ncbi:MAG: SDR family NAD(P)-dependent oxidoreductase [Pirellulaceae bacterium]
MMDTGLSGKVVLVTGAAGGLGSEMVRAFAREGARVVLHYRRSAEAAERLLGEIGASDHISIQADLTCEDDVARLWRASEQRLGPIEIVIANAGIWVADDVPLQDMSLEQWNETVSNDLTSVFLCMREFFRGIKRHRLREPSAVLIGSTAAVFGEAGHGDYAAAKGGLVYGFLLSLKNEITRLASLGRVNAVCPGWTVTPMTERFLDEPATVRRALQTVPLRKVGRPEEVASAVLFLASSRLSGHVTGQMIMTCGGMEGRVLFDPDEIDPSQA